MNGIGRATVIATAAATVTTAEDATDAGVTTSAPIAVIGVIAVIATAVLPSATGSATSSAAIAVMSGHEGRTSHNREGRASAGPTHSRSASNHRSSARKACRR